ncbi:MAG: RluA family pseudouridine synthase [Gemmatimonadetes bacterium]|nr:RluA family pseudouridine synthase [Gemmatimonadota bacterium]
MAVPPATRFCVATDGAERLDRFLADQLQLSRTVAARLIADGAVSVAGEKARRSLAPPRGTEIEVVFPERQPRQVTPADIALAIVYEDEELAVIDKPAGLVVHPAPGHWDDTLVNALASRGMHLGGGAEGRPGIVHRLDKDTSGLLVVAKTARAHQRLGAALAARRIERRYAVLAWGHLGPNERRIEAPLARHPADRTRMHIPRGVGGRLALTRVRTVARGGPADLLHVALETGRTHQIRVHLQSIGHPVVGDPVYGGADVRRSDATRHLADALARATPRQALHAAWLRFPHPATGESLDIRSEWPADLRQALALALDDAVLLADSKPLQYLGFFACGAPNDRP